jgi:ABC-2 type transport system ATP-binding protein
MSVLAFTDLRKSYASTMATDDVTFEVRSGEVFGLLGPNGAGKSTLIRMLMDIIAPDAGEIRLDGRPLGPGDRDRIGYLPEERGLYRKEKAIDVLVYFGMLKGLDRGAARQRGLAWLERMDLSALAERRIDQMSKGQQQKVQFVATLLHDPAIIAVDEPFAGLDPINTVLVRDLLKEKSRDGCIVLLSTHQMPLVEALCDRVAMIHRGRLVLYGPLEEIRRQNGEASVLVEVEGDLPAIDVAERVLRQGPRQRVFLKAGARPRDLMERLLRQGIPLLHFEVVRPPLEEIFVRTVRRVEAEPAESGALAGARS